MTAAWPEAGSEDGAEGVESERCAAFGAGGLVTVVDFPALGPSSAALELCGPAEVGAFAFAAVGAFGSARLACVVALGACFCVLLLDPVRVPAAFFVPVVVSGDVLAPEAPLEDAVVRPAAGFLAGLVGWSVLMATTVRRVLRAV